MPETTKTKDCVACRRAIDDTARLCPYCGADPETGRKFDTTPILKTHFPDQKEMSARERILSFLRERQGIVVSAGVVVVFLLITAAHQIATRRNAAAESDVPAIPLTEIAGLNDASDQQELPIPQADFTWVGRPETMDVMLIEPGAVAPPPEAVPPTPSRVSEPARPRPAAASPAAAQPNTPSPASGTPPSSPTATQTGASAAEPANPVRQPPR